MTGTQTQQRIGWSEFSDGKAAARQELSRSLCTPEGGGMLTGDSCMKRQSQMVSVGVAAAGKQSSGHKYGVCVWGAPWKTLSVHAINICTLTRGRFCHFPEPNPGKTLPFFCESKALGSWTWACPCQTIHIHSYFYSLPAISCLQIPNSGL